MHIVLIIFDPTAKEFHIATFKEDNEDQAREYADYLKACDAALDVT